MSQRRRGKTPVPFHDPPATTAPGKDYKKILANAKGGTPDRPGPLEGTRSFDDIPKEAPAPPPSHQGADEAGLSATTVDGLSAFAAANAQRAAEEAAVPLGDVSEDLDHDDRLKQIRALDLEIFAEHSPRVLALAIRDLVHIYDESRLVPHQDDQLTKMRKAVESRIEDIDIGSFIMSGEIQQDVIIIPASPGNKGLTVTYRSVTDEEESYADMEIAKKDLEKMISRQYNRTMNEMALSFHIVGINGTDWPKVLSPDGSVNEEAFKARLVKVRRLAPQLFNLISSNLVWFLERVEKGINFEVLGNG